MLEDLDLHEPTRPEQLPEPTYIKREYVPLAALDLLEELAKQFIDATNLYASIENSPSTPANQKAQVLNSLSNIISQISKTQEAIHNVQKLKILEETLIQTLKTLPEEAQEAFFKEYEERLEHANK